MNYVWMFVDSDKQGQHSVVNMARLLFQLENNKMAMIGELHSTR